MRERGLALVLILVLGFLLFRLLVPTDLVTRASLRVTDIVPDWVTGEDAAIPGGRVGG